MTLEMSAMTCKTLKTHTHTHKNPYLCMQVWVLPGMGTGWPGIPQGYPCYSLAMVGYYGGGHCRCSCDVWMSHGGWNRRGLNG